MVNLDSQHACNWRSFLAHIGAAGSHAPAMLDERIEAFLSEFLADLEGQAEDEFEQHREALISAKRQKDHSLEDQASRHWEQVRNRRCASWIISWN